MKMLDCRGKHALHIILPILTLLMSACVTMENSRDYSRQPLPSSVTELKVLTYNIRLGAGTGIPNMDVYHLPWGRNLFGVIAAIKSVDADIVALQEVAGPGQAQELAAALNLNFAYEYHQNQTAMRRSPWWGVAILSKFPITEFKGTQISARSVGSLGALCRSHIIAVTVDITQKPYTFVSIHKDLLPLDGSSLRNVLSAIAEVQGPVMLAGDLNMMPSDPRLELLSPRFVDTATVLDTPTARNVVSSGTHVHGRIDYVFSEVSNFSVIDVGLLPQIHWRASDHVGYWARLSLK